MMIKIEKYLNNYNSFILNGEKFINFIMFNNQSTFKTFDIGNYTFQNSAIKTMLSLDIDDESYSGYSVNSYMKIDYLPRIKGIEKIYEDNTLQEIFNTQCISSNDEKLIFITFSISLFFLNQMYICFKNPSRNIDLIERLYIFFDNTDVTGHEKRILNEKSSIREKERYLKIKFAFLFESLTRYISEEFNISIPNSKYSIFLIKDKYFKISTYDDETLDKVPFEFEDFSISSKNLIIIKSNDYTSAWYAFYYLLTHKKDYSICDNCFKIFQRYTNKLSNICSDCSALSDSLKNNYYYDNDRKNREHEANRRKIQYIETHYKDIQELLDIETLNNIDVLIKKKHSSIRNGNNLNNIYSIVLSRYEEKFPPQKTERKGNVIY